MPFKKSLCLCAAALMLLSVGSANVNAASHSNKPNRVARHLSNVKRAAQVKATHVKNVRRINRIKRHLISHQKNLIKISKRLNRAQRHHRNAQLITRLSHDKARLIKAVENNERGMVRLAKTVANEEHQINLMRHPNHQSQAREPANHSQTTAKSIPNSTNSTTQVTLPSVKPTDQSYSIGRSVSTFISEVNGKLTKYVAKDSNSWNRNGQSKSNQYSDVDGQYSASPAQITQDEINQLNQQIQNEMQNSNQWFKDVNNEINADFNLF